jgi:hypothetical protein
MPLVVGVEKSDKLSLRFPDPPVACRRQPLVWLEHELDTVLERPQSIGKTIGRSIVDDHNLDPGIGLHERGADRGAHESNCIEAWNDYRNGGQPGHDYGASRRVIS